MGRTIRDGVYHQDITYGALPSQRLFRDSEARFKGFSGPVGSGKSQALCQEALRLAMVNEGRTGLLGAPTYPMLREATQAALFEIMDRDEMPYEYNKAENVIRMKDGGSRILLRPVDDYERLRGTNLAWFGLDELTYTQEAAWLRLEARLRDPMAKRLCGFAAWTPKGYDWVYQRFLANPVNGYHTVVAQAFENRHILNKVPDFYDRLKRSYDETLYQQEALGQYLSLHGGLVYKAFDRRDHVQTLRMEQNSPLLWALDFNVDPMSSVVVQIAGTKILVLDEIVLRHASTLEACEEFSRRFPNHSAGLVVYGDASGNTQQTTGASDYQIVKDFFRARYGTRVSYKVPKANPVVRERLQLVNSKLRTAAGEIHMLVDGKCKELITDFEQVAYKEDTNAIDKEKDRRRTHLSDALGYVLWQEFRPAPVIGEHRERLI
jgi:hypothetical protein